MTNQEYTNLRTEVAEEIEYYALEIVVPITGKVTNSYEENALEIQRRNLNQFAGKIEALINKRWQDWIEACGLEINQSDSRDFLADYPSWANTYFPNNDNLNRFSPLSKEK